MSVPRRRAMIASVTQNRIRPRPECTRVFLLSPANMGGRRGQSLLHPRTGELGQRLLAGAAVPLGEVFTYISSLYFRGKLAYAQTFCPSGTYVITAGHGLLQPATPVTLDTLREFSTVAIDEGEAAFVEPLVRDVQRLCDEAGEVVLLGSVASSKYTAPLLRHLGSRLLFPTTFVGRGDMSRGGVLLRAVRDGTELEYAPVSQAVLHGRRPPKLPPVA